MRIKYSDYVDYEKLDPIKRLALEIFEPTLIYPERLDIKIIPETLGQTAVGFDFSGICDSDFFLVSNVEGLGTKNLIADVMYKETKNPNLYLGLGQDPAAMSLNDLVCLGADPFVYNDIITCGNSEWFKDLERVRQLLTGYRIAADLGGFAIPQGETPELKGVVYPETLDLAGSSSGIIRPKSRMIIGNKIREGDRIYGLVSSGIHANGLSKARGIAGKLPDGFFTKLENGRTLGEELLTPTTIYARPVMTMFDEGIDVHYLQPITGHGWKKIARAKGPFDYVVENIPEPPLIFRELTRLSEQTGFDVSDRENYYVWNMGIGYVVIAPMEFERNIRRVCSEYGIDVHDLGYVTKGERRVLLRPKDIIYVTD